MQRPKLKIVKSDFDKILEYLTFGVLVFMFAYIYNSNNQLPEIIPIHFDSTGKPDGFGSRSMIWLAPAIGFVLCIGIYILNYFPHKFNYLVKITGENAYHQYNLAQSMLRKLNLSLALTFLIISYVTIKSALNKSESMEIIYIVYIMLGIFGIIFHYLYQSSKK
ncbi:MAG: DUF1648 domain-containing protein [Candidatus Kapabacteria bacterium]|nr:DUF1648 domain-containing protein [Ignavibacteriota bacterium]MCW5885561.1 DUF1648 domain-containing protein [Candidatus Kapabacteria bacterium]